jgi:tetratricopeptide (TPR) repeat protein
MEGRRQLDTISRSLPRSFVALVVLFCFVLPHICCAQTSPPDKRNLERLLRQEHWQELIDLIERAPVRDADLDYYYGTALAQLGHYDDARKVFVEGHRLLPADKRFPTELGGVAFKQKRYSEAVRWLRRALRLDPRDAYVNEFLATIYYLQGNVEAAVKYWNRVDKPQIHNIGLGQPLRIQWPLLNRAFAFAPASQLRLPELRTSEERVAGLGVLSTYRFDLAAQEDGKFDVTFRAQERNRFGNNKWEALLSAFRGVYYQTVYLDYFNAERSAININSLVRWDAQKRRILACVSGPLERNPKYRYQLGVDLRQENWDIRSSFKGFAPLLGASNLRREAVSGGITSFNSGRWGWSMGAEMSHRGYRDVFLGTALTPSLLLTGYQLKHLAGIHYELLRVPERRFDSRLQFSSQLGSIWSSPTHTFEKLQGTLGGHWFPLMQGDDYATRGQVSAGKIFGGAPFDELFMLGLERDNDLWLRAHIGTRDGRKGGAPLGHRYFLSNWETDKNVYNNGFFHVTLGPFLDTGKISGALQPALNKWLVDTGLQAKVRVLGVGVTFIYGKDLRSGNNAFYVTALQ